MNTILSVYTRFAADKRAVTALEYGMIAALIAAVIATAVGTLGTNINSTFVSLAAKT